MNQIFGVKSRIVKESKEEVVIHVTECPMEGHGRLASWSMRLHGTYDYGHLQEEHGGEGVRADTEATELRSELLQILFK